jgi:hypothetical protein
LPIQPEKTSLVEELIERASVLPVENQETLLAIAKGMALTRRCEQARQKGDGQQTA